MKTMQELEMEIENAKKRVQELQDELKKAKKQFVEEMKAKGWQEFLFESDYYGSHQELGDGNEERLYLFRPGIDLSEWRGCRFAHGSRGANKAYERFQLFLEGLIEETDFIIVDEKTF